MWYVIAYSCPVYLLLAPGPAYMYITEKISHSAAGWKFLSQFFYPSFPINVSTSAFKTLMFMYLVSNSVDLDYFRIKAHRRSPDIIW